MTGM